MKKYVTYLLILLVSFLFLSVLSTSAALNIEKGMIYAPNSFCTLKARIVSINGQNISFKIIDIIGLSQKFYQDFDPKGKIFLTKIVKNIIVQIMLLRHLPAKKT